MNADAAIESLLAAAYRFQCGLRESEIFLMGSTEDSEVFLKEIKQEIVADLNAYGPPIPFQKTLLIMNQSSAKELEIFKKAGNETDEDDEQFTKDYPRQWAASLVSPGPSNKSFKFIVFAHVRGSWELSVEGEVEYREVLGKVYDVPIPNPEKCFLHFPKGEPRGEKVNWRSLTHSERISLGFTGSSIGWMLGLLSHPLNYIIRESPQLTDHEAKRIQAGKRFPDAKRPRYIILDHDVLVGMQKPIGTHASPVPHKRRGHWMRLSERCRHARERGQEKVFVRDCYVGERDFVQNGRRYQVLLDFQDKVRLGVGI